VSDPLNAILEYSKRKGIKGLHQTYVNRCWEVRVDSQWYFAVNPNKHPVKCETGVEVEPFCAYFEYNGWPGILSFANGGEFAAGTGANAETFVAALEAAS